MARSDRLPREPNLPRNVQDARDWVRQLVARLNSLLTQTFDSVNLLIDGYMLHVGSDPTPDEKNRGRMVILRGATGARDRLKWVRKDEDDVNRVVEVACGPVKDVLVGVGSVDVSSVPAGGSAFVDVVVPGASPGDPAVASLSTTGAVNVLTSAHVSAADTVRVVFYNVSGAPWDPVAGTVRVTVFKT